MAGSIIYALMLFGCSDDLSQCDRLSFQTQSFDVRSSCLDAQPAVLSSKQALSAPYPTVVAQCLTPEQAKQLPQTEIDLTKVTAP